MRIKKLKLLVVTAVLSSLSSRTEKCWPMAGKSTSDLMAMWKCSKKINKEVRMSASLVTLIVSGVLGIIFVALISYK